MSKLSKGEKHFIMGGIHQNLRNDGRERFKIGPWSLELGVISVADGSAKFCLRGTHVIACVRGVLARPSPDHPNDGNIYISVNCSPTADLSFEGKKGEELSKELSADLENCLLGGKDRKGCVIDLSTLSIKEGKLCWNLFIDCEVINFDGNLLDALSVAIRAAASSTVLPVARYRETDSSNELPHAEADEFSDVEIAPENTLRLAGGQLLPIIVTLTKFGKHFIVDATSEEEFQMSSAVSVSVNRRGKICGAIKRGGTGISPDVMLAMLDVAKSLGMELIRKLEVACIGSCVDGE